MSTRTATAIAIWRARSIRADGDRGFLVYMVIMVALVTVVPLARAVWLNMSSVESVAVLSSPAAPAAATFLVALLWALGILIGRDRGPALRPPLLTHVFATGDLQRSEAFRGPLLRAGFFVISLTTVTAGLVGGALLSHGLTDLLSASVFTAIAAVVGVITTLTWLAGQTFPRLAVSVGLGFLVLGALSAFVPVTQVFTPWGWAGLAYPGGTPATPAPLTALSAVAVLLAVAAPSMLNRLDSSALAEQAARWESATIHAAGMDFSMAVGLYRGRPHRGRRSRAVRPLRRLAWTFLVRDALGALRTPGRLIAGILALGVAGALVALAFMPGVPREVLGAFAGLIVFAALGPLTDGIRHAASVAADLPLYGISDERLIANHSLFPLALILIVSLAVVTVVALATGGVVVAPLLGSVVLGMLMLVARVSNTLKGPLPPELLTPIPTPMGDLGAAVRMAGPLTASCSPPSPVHPPCSRSSRLSCS